MPLYHTDLGLPEALLQPFLNRSFALEYGPHARQAAATDRYGKVIPPARLILRRENVFEVEVENGSVVKVCVRISSGFVSSAVDCDLILVLSPSRYGSAALFVRTVWHNQRSDVHKTLQRGRYAETFSSSSSQKDLTFKQNCEKVGA